MEVIPTSATALLCTNSGRLVNVLALTPSDVDIKDIAHSLSLLNRFVGHTDLPISVAQHSVYVSRLVPPRHALQALLHDASESYCSDLSRWLKQMPEMAAYRAAEERAQRVIFDVFACDRTLAPEVVEADWLMVRYEAYRAYGARWRLGHLAPMPTPAEVARVGEWEPWSWQVAEAAFLDRFVLLRELAAA